MAGLERFLDWRGPCGRVRVRASAELLGEFRDGLEQICDEAEEVLWMETTAETVPAMMQRLTELHPYDVPKILAVEPNEAPPSYLDWVRKLGGE